MQKKVYYRFYVEGQGPFPIDMLRYDRAWPDSEPDAYSISRTFDHYLPPKGTSRAIRLAMFDNHGPTVGRWDSFGWKVTEVTKEAP